MNKSTITGVPYNLEWATDVNLELATDVNLVTAGLEEASPLAVNIGW